MRMQTGYLLLSIMLALGLSGCAAPAPGPEALGEKSDEEELQCRHSALVQWMNDVPERVRGAQSDEAAIEVAKAALDELDVWANARNSLVKHMAGPDGRLGTDACPDCGLDDERFDDLAAATGDTIASKAGEDINPGEGFPEGLAELTHVRMVGDGVFGKLVEAMAPRCIVEPETPANASVIFSPAPRDESHLARVEQLITEARRSVDIAMYSFRDAGIQRALFEAAQDPARNVRVRVIYNKGRDECGDVTTEGTGADKTYSCPVNAGTLSQRLEDAGIDVRYVNKIMHHKFAIIDGVHASTDDAAETVLVSGSGNWTPGAATSLDENTLFLSNVPELALRYQQEFNHLWAHSRDVVGNDTIQYFESEPITDAMIADVDEPSTHALFTSANFSTSGQMFRVDRDSNEIADALVELILGAERSVLVASGHLRSRPVAMALMERQRRATADGQDFDMRVYLDSQEYISASRHRRLLEALEACIVAAGASQTEQNKCYDKGFLFGYMIWNEAQVDVRYKYYAYRWNYAYAPQMHHKYLVIDGETLVTGSYNLSDNAEHGTMENMTVLHADGFGEIVQTYVDAFEQMWRTTSDPGYDALMADVCATRARGFDIDDLERACEPVVGLPLATGEDRFRIVFSPDSLAWPEVNQLKQAMAAACPAINSREFRRNPTAHFWCPTNPSPRRGVEVPEVDAILSVLGDEDYEPSIEEIWGITEDE